MNWLTQLADSASFGHMLAQFEADLQSPGFWLALGKIIWINVLLSGDNALVIALACRGLHGRHRFWGMVAGSGIAVALRIAFTGIVATLMALPYLKLVGGLALLVIAAKLLVPEDENDEIAAGTTLWHAVRIVALDDNEANLNWNVAVGMVRPDDALREAMEAALARLRADGTVARIYNRYGVTLQAPK